MKRNYQEEVVSPLYDLDARISVGVCATVGSSVKRYSLYYAQTNNHVQIGNFTSTEPYSNNKIDPLPKILLTAGIHGDEPAGVYALLRFMQGPLLNYLDRFNFLIFPCLNPWGFENDKRKNINGVDINRSFMMNTSVVALVLKTLIRDNLIYSFAMNLHEDDPLKPVGNLPIETNPRAFYLYEEQLNGRSIGMPIIRKLRDQEVKICSDVSIYGEGNQGGVIYSRSTSGELEQFLQRFTNNILTPETPTIWPLEERVRVHLIAIEAALNMF
ncbi:MAG: M14 family metallocarboxypeptidase [Candidatus Woesearchaeota archaeon]